MGVQEYTYCAICIFFVLPVAFNDFGEMVLNFVDCLRVETILNQSLIIIFFFLHLSYLINNSLKISFLIIYLIILLKTFRSVPCFRLFSGSELFRSVF